jgi:hypothetical protein
MLLDCKECAKRHSDLVGRNTDIPVSETQSRFGRDDGQNFPYHCRDLNFCKKFWFQMFRIFTAAKNLDSAKDYLDCDILIFSSVSP